ncbi:MAG: 2-oxo-4-hydroxy-4-carboxy-5-ureidoimidazoline decarboxylase [Nocardioidaceae bacterium]
MSADQLTTAIDRFNELAEGDARELLRACLAVPRWVDEVVSGRPYDDINAVHAQAHASAATMTDEELAAALTRHPRIGERLPENDPEARRSHSEQAGVNSSDQQLAERLQAGNLTYERRFSRVFLIRAAGRSADEILAELERRLAHDDETERVETATQLREIALLRLDRALAT